MFHPEVLTTELLTLLKQRPEGVTMDVETLSPREGNYYAIGGFVQTYDGFGALLYRIVEDLRLNDLLNSEEFYGDLSNRISVYLDQIREHGCLGAWFENGELFIDVVEAWECRCNEAEHANPEALGTGVARLAVRQAHANKQDAIGHVCDRVDGGYETIYLNKVGA